MMVNRRVRVSGQVGDSVRYIDPKHIYRDKLLNKERGFIVSPIRGVKPRLITESEIVGYQTTLTKLDVIMDKDLLIYSRNIITEKHLSCF